MAVVRTGNTPDHVRDIGPAAAAVDGMAAMGRLSALRVDRGALVADVATAQGAGPIERRYVTPSRAQEDPVTVAPTPPAAVPCGTCLHEPVCRLRAMLTELGPLSPVQVIDAGLRAVATAWVLECDHHLETPGARGPRLVRTADRDAESRRRGAQATKGKKAEAREKAERATAALAALERHNGDQRAAAAELGMPLNGFVMVIKHARLRAEAVL